MDLNEFEIDIEAVESTIKQINYYLNLPAHIKRRASELKDVKPNVFSSENSMPAHLIDGANTVIRGKMNIPVLNHVTFTHESIEDLPLDKDFIAQHSFN